MAVTITKKSAQKAPKKGTDVIEKALVIEYWDTDKLIPYGKNAKLHPSEQVDTLADSITKYRFDVPIVVDKDGVIIKGHGRRLAAQKAGLKKVPVIVRDDMDEDATKAARIADNKIAETPWDDFLLAKELSELESMGMDLTELGFNEADLARLDTLESDAKLDYEEEWKGMPEFTNKDALAYRSIIVHFRSVEEIAEFRDLLGTKITDKTKYLYFKEEPIAHVADIQYVDSEVEGGEV